MMEPVDKTIISPMQCRLGRTAIGWGVRDLASKAKMSPNTVFRFESDKPTLPATVEKLKSVMEKAGVVFKANGDGPGVHLRRK